ncbi:response regulator [Mucilaginibacter robiniae]|uniref:Response regulator n=1 Tax=Mucilaginibacter robiniae TaxID=2728022 RepID=A0A7L5DY15_9SPHI|nr:response regulator [Mucilaginibacter robiniae]QJD95990.1 response regulator [Mucilaginibacter robiniae]
MKASKTKVLVCDDDRDILEMTGMLLEMEGYEVTTQSDSTKVLQQASEVQPDVFLLDFWMPHPSGEKLIQLIKASPRLSHIPVILFSAAINARQIAQASGADGYIDKPFDMEKLTAVIKTVMKQ